MILVEEANSVKSFKKSQKTKQPVVEIKFARNLFISLNLTILKTNGKHVYQGASLLFSADLSELQYQFRWAVFMK